MLQLPTTCALIFSRCPKFNLKSGTQRRGTQGRWVTDTSRWTGIKSQHTPHFIPHKASTHRRVLYLACSKFPAAKTIRKSEKRWLTSYFQTIAMKFSRRKKRSSGNQPRLDSIKERSFFRGLFPSSTQSLPPASTSQLQADTNLEKAQSTSGLSTDSPSPPSTPKPETCLENTECEDANLWDLAYDALLKAEPEIVESYEDILNAELAKSGEHS